jgi:3-isopropylmalate dehydratase small subunit
MKTLQELVERNPRTELRIDLTAGTCEAGDVRCGVSLPPNVRDAFATGAWDTTGLLLDRYEEVNAKASKLPYVAGF